MLLLLAALPTFALAQTPLDQLKIGQTVRVMDTHGAETRGAVAAVSPTALEITTTAGAKRLAMADIFTVSKKDSNKSGFYIGTAFGAISTLAIYDQWVRDQRATDPRATFPSKPTMTIVTGLFYGGVGALIDSFVDGRVVVYQKTDKTDVHVAPIVNLAGSKRVGLGGTISWR